MKKAFSCFLLLLLSTFLCGAQDISKRVALVIGNGAYPVNPLRNPLNDADDIAAALIDAGFDVDLEKDVDITEFERAITVFAAKLQGVDTGLFYYAGHGVSVDGMNYLIPVHPSIDSISSVKAKAVAVDTIIGRIESAGVRTALVFLDSCRDNPFPGASRSGARGLSVVTPPHTMNSLIAYATSPGETAAEGEGRNGIFSGAFVNELRQPGQELTVIMRKVKAAVALATGNKQQPRVDDGMKEPYYFSSPEAMSAIPEAKQGMIESALKLQQNDLGGESTTRQAELEKLSQSSLSDDPDILIKTVEGLEKVLQEMEGNYEAMVEKSLAAINAVYDKNLVDISKQQPDITETDSEFEDRITREKREVEAKRTHDLEKIGTDTELQKTTQTEAMRQQFTDVLDKLQTRTWILSGSVVSLKVGKFDRNARTWPFIVESKDKKIPLGPVELVARLGDASDPRKAIRELDAAVKANTLAGEVEWGLVREKEMKQGSSVPTYVVIIRAIRVMNLTNNAVFVQENPNKRIAFFTAGKRATPTSIKSSIAPSSMEHVGWALDFQTGGFGAVGLDYLGTTAAFGITYQFNNIFSLGSWLGLIIFNLNYYSPSFPLGGLKFIIGNKIDSFALSINLGLFPSVGFYYRNYFLNLVYWPIYPYPPLLIEIGYSFFKGK